MRINILIVIFLLLITLIVIFILILIVILVVILNIILSENFSPLSLTSLQSQSGRGPLRPCIGWNLCNSDLHPADSLSQAGKNWRRENSRRGRRLPREHLLSCLLSRTNKPTSAPTFQPPCKGRSDAGSWTGFAVV